MCVRLWLLVLVSCNGILCLYNNKVISLWNLSIRRKLVVPRRPPLETNSSKVALGFGFDPITDDYNIVAVSYNSSAFIYSLKADSWSAMRSPSTRLSHAYVEPKLKACFFNGILHWVGYGFQLKHEVGWSWTHFILTFDLSSRVFGYIWLHGSWIIEQVTTINGCLAVVSPEHYDDDGDEYSLIQVMKEYGNSESWSELFKLKDDEFYGMTVFQPVINGDILAYCHEGSKVCNTQTRLTNCSEFGPDCSKLDMDTYVESLELVDKERAAACGKTVFSWKT
ncbi:F-box/kelch-repeat protein At3g06240-like [Bidens hawaiensis]|uniref:F-box/kelch-repeat protein At3g06240-like n=1 Tax=Bidens hawaiensis TaxID=980011 RepID=UPI00404B6E16